jgi:hypothetical protein
MGDVYNRKLFQAKARPAREKLAKMAGIMASSPELMQAANQGSDKTPTPPSTGGARPMMPPPPAPMMTPPPQPTVPQLPQVPMQTAMAPAPMMQAPAPRPMAPAPAVPQPAAPTTPMKFKPGGPVTLNEQFRGYSEMGERMADAALNIEQGPVDQGISLYDKLKEKHGSEEKVEAVVAEKDKKIDDAQKTGDPKQISNAILEAAEVEPTKENKMDFAANVLNLKDVNDINEIDNRIAQASLAVGVGKRVGGDTAIAEAVLLGLNNYKQTAAARAAAVSGAKASTYTPERLFQQAVEKIMANPEQFDVYNEEGSAVDPMKVRREAMKIAQTTATAMTGGGANTDGNGQMVAYDASGKPYYSTDGVNYVDAQGNPYVPPKE